MSSSLYSFGGIAFPAVASVLSVSPWRASAPFLWFSGGFNCHYGGLHNNAHRFLSLILIELFAYMLRKQKTNLLGGRFGLSGQKVSPLYKLKFGYDKIVNRYYKSSTMVNTPVVTFLIFVSMPFNHADLLDRLKG